MTDTKDTTETKAPLIDTGVVTLSFVAIKSPVNKYQSTDKEFRVRAQKWATETDRDTLAKTLKAINKDIVLDVHRIKKESELGHEDNFIFNASAKDRPIVLDADKNILSAEEIPMVTNATARLKLVPFEGKNGKGGGVNLVAIQLLSFDLYEGSGPAYDADEIANAF